MSKTRPMKIERVQKAVMNHEPSRTKERRSNVEADRVVMKPEYVERTWNYIIRRYQGPSPHGQVIESFGLSPSDVEFISAFQEQEESRTVLLSLFHPHELLVENLVEVPKIDMRNCSNGDIIYVTKIPESLSGDATRRDA